MTSDTPIEREYKMKVRVTLDVEVILTAPSVREAEKRGKAYAKTHFHRHDVRKKVSDCYVTGGVYPQYGKSPNEQKLKRAWESRNFWSGRISYKF